MGNSRHIILRQIVELQTTATGEDYRALSERAGQLGREFIPAILEAVLDRLDRPGETLRFDRLEVEVRCGPHESWEAAIARQLADQLERLLGSAQPVRPGGPDGELPDEALFFFFLTHGYLPWFAARDLTLPELEYRLTEALARNPALARRWVARLRQGQVLRRLLYQFSDKMPWRIASALAVTAVPRLEELPAFFTGDYNFWKRFLDDPSAALEAMTPGRKPETAPDGVGPEEDPLPEDLPESPPEEGIYFRTAGAILLHPYLPALFRRLECVEEDRLIDPEKALYLLHYAATGSDRAAEWELPLAKLLCGLPLHRPVAGHYALTQAERTETDAMVAAAIGHWKALKKTSPDGLRDAFLQRDGRLTKDPSGWRLQVEQRSFDILLDQLPWSIAIVKLPWMPAPVFTEWV